MGNYKFRLADMMPNAWFYKLRDMSNKPRSQISSQPLNQKITKKKKKKNTTFHNSSSSPSSSPSTITTTTTLSSKPNQPHQHSPRKSYYITRDLNSRDRPNSPTNPKKSSQQENQNFFEPPRKSSKERPRRRRPGLKQSQKQLLVINNCKATLESAWTKPDSSPEFSPESSPENEFSGEREFRCDGILATNRKMTFDCGKVCSCRDHQENCKENDIVINVDKASLAKQPDSPGSQFDTFAKVELPPIITKSNSKPKKSPAANNNNNHQNNSNSPGIRLRINHSPRIINKRLSGLRKSVTSSSSATNSRRSRSLSDSFAVVKSSLDPQKDFRESMVEMIIENDIKASKDLEDLLACYLSLNSDEYHGMIIKVFKQIWFDLTDIS